MTANTILAGGLVKTMDSPREIGGELCTIGNPNERLASRQLDTRY